MKNFKKGEDYYLNEKNLVVFTEKYLLKRGFCCNKNCRHCPYKVLLTREEFKKQVFDRDNNECVVCQSPAVDAHHILERKLFEDSGYYLDNGVSLCEEHHWQAEKTELSCSELRRLARIKAIILPKDFDSSKEYDKWGNEVLLNNFRIPGPLFDDTGCQRALKEILWKFKSF